MTGESPLRGVQQHSEFELNTVVGAHVMDPSMHEKKYYHEVVEPAMRLVTRASENVCVEPDFSDVISLAKQVATSAYHFREPILRKLAKDKIGSMADKNAEALRQRLGDVVDSAKHGMLKCENRSTTFQAKLAFEYDPILGFKFLRTEVLATNKRSGMFELTDAILEFIPLLGKELGVNVLFEKTESQSHPFLEWAETYLTPKSGFSLQGVGIRTYQRDTNGALSLVRPLEVKFRVMQQ